MRRIENYRIDLPIRVLFPITADKQIFPRIGLEGPSKNSAEPLLSSANFAELMRAADSLGIKAPNGTASIGLPSDFVVVAFRYDPCSPKDHMGPEVSDCLPERGLSWSFTIAILSPRESVTM